MELLNVKGTPELLGDCVSGGTGRLQGEWVIGDLKLGDW